MAKDYVTGFGKPPKETQFVKGLSGNPRGRPKGSKNLATTLHEITSNPIRVSENGKGSTVTKLHAILLQLVNKAVAGDLKAAKEILQWHQFFESIADRESTGNPDAAKNELVMKSFIQKVRAMRSAVQPAAIRPLEATSDDDTNG